MASGLAGESWRQLTSQPACTHLPRFLMLSSWASLRIDFLAAGLGRFPWIKHLIHWAMSPSTTNFSTIPQKGDYV
jgi:hypothetical protein